MGEITYYVLGVMLGASAIAPLLSSNSQSNKCNHEQGLHFSSIAMKTTLEIPIFGHSRYSPSSLLPSGGLSPNLTPNQKFI